MSSKEVIVWISLRSEDIRIGKLWFHVKGHKESTSFEYDKKWLDHPERFALEPALKLTEGSFHTGQGLSLFGGFGDSDFPGSRLPCHTHDSFARDFEQPPARVGGS